MKNKNKAVQASLLLTTLLSSLLVATQAQADSAYEWGYWDSAPPVKVKQFEFHNQKIVTAEQERLGTNKGELVTSAETETPWIGYAVYSYGVSGNEYVYEDNKVAVLHLTPVKLSTEPAQNVEGYPGTLATTSDYASFNMNFATSSNFDDDNGNYSYFAIYTPDSEGGFYGQSGSYSSVGGNQNRSQKQINTYASTINTEQSGEYIAGLNVLNSTSSYDSQTEQYSATYSFGRGIIGKVMPLADIAAQARLGATYNFYGDSFYNSQVAINVNFGNASWQGSWGSTDNGISHDGFTAAGNISGATLSGAVTHNINPNARIVDPTTSLNYVQSGTVAATLVGVMNDGASSNAAIIGKTQLNVGAVGTQTRAVNDVFYATMNGNNNR